MLGWLFNNKEEEKRPVDIGQVEVFIELYNGKVITKVIKGTYDTFMDGYYSPVEHQLSYFMEKVRKDNVLEISKGYSVNIAKEIKSVVIGDRKPLIVEM